MHHPIRLVVIGAGKMAEGFHLPSIRRYMAENPGVLELVGVSDPIAERGRLFVEKFGIERWDPDTVAMLREVQPDAAYVLVPYPDIGRTSFQVLASGIHAFMEKPPGLSLMESENLAKVAHENNLITMVGFNRLYQPAIRMAKSWLEDQAKPLHFIRACKHRKTRFHQDYMFYIAIHMINLVLWFGGEVIGLRQLREPTPSAKGFNSAALLRFSSGALGSISAFPGLGYDEEVLELHTPKGTAVIDTQFGHKEIDHLTLRIYEGERQLQEKIFPLDEDRIVTEGFYGETRSFLDALRGGPLPYPRVEDCIMTMTLAEAIQKGMDWER